MMDDHLKAFYKDSNKISGEDHIFLTDELMSQPLLASQQFFDFWEGKSEGKDPDPVEEDDWRAPTYQEFYRIPKEAVANRDFQTIARSYLERTTIDNDQSDMISGTALNLAGGLGLNKEGDVDRLANAIRAQLGIARPTLGLIKSQIASGINTGSLRRVCYPRTWRELMKRVERYWKTGNTLRVTARETR